jgi:Subtilase family
MLPGKSPRFRAGSCSILAFGLACAATAAPALAAADRPHSGDLSRRLAKLAKPPLRSASPARQAKALDLATHGPGSLLRKGNRVIVEVRFDSRVRAGLDDLRRAGAKVLEVNPRYQRVTVAVKPTALSKLAHVPRVAGTSVALTPVTAALTPCFGDATSEGDTQLHAAEAREKFGVDGGGVTVGLLSDSFNRNLAAPTHAIKDVESGDLPGAGNPCEREDEVGIFDDTETKGEDEGRAMGQIVHDLAPGAKLAFATAFKKTMFGFADNIRKLAEPTASGGAEADVIVDDVSYFEEPFFQEGPVGVAVREVSEAGVSYFSSAGNNNLRNGEKDFTSWEAPEFRDASPTPCPIEEPGFGYAQHCMDFDPGPGVDTGFDITVAGGSTLNIDLQWAQPWEGVTTDLDAYLVNSLGEVIADSEEFNVASTQLPFEFFFWKNPSKAPQTVQLAIDRCDLSCDPENGGDEGTPPVKFALMENGGGVLATEYESSNEGDVVGPTIFGHNGAKDAVSVGAIRYSTNLESPNAAPEYFSSRGPVTHYFGPVTSGSPAPALSEPETLAKPDVVATDGGANTFFGSCFPDAWRFFGTSASAPHAAAIAALELQAKPAATPAEVSQAQREGAVAVGSFPSTAVGAGMLDAVSTIEKLGVSPSFPSAPVPPPAPLPCTPEEPEEPQPEGPSPSPGPGPGGSQNPPGGGEQPAPATFFRHRPPAVLRTAGRTAIAVFRFGSDQSGVSFLCKFDRGKFRPCQAHTVRHFSLGTHVLRVKALNAAGKVDPTPAVFRFRVLPAPAG